MSAKETFSIREIGSEVAAHQGLPDGCDLCGHCRFLNRMKERGIQVALPCGRSLAERDAEGTTPLIVLRNHSTATRSSS